MNQPFSPIDPTAVKLSDPVLAGRIESCRKTTIPAAIAQCRKHGRIDAYRLDWKEGMPNPPHIFGDSEFAKVLEGMALTLAQNPDDQALAEELDSFVDLVISAQQPDGYLNTHFTVVEPEKRWSNLYFGHELFGAGHTIEAAVAHFRATGKRKFLDALCRYADYIASVFGPEPGKRRGYPGHEEIEMALCKLSDVTGERKYLDLAKYFIDERGRQPNYFVLEGEKQNISRSREALMYNQSHIPVREQTEAVGHAVRALFLYSGMADVAVRTDDEGLLNVCRTLFESIVEKHMYLTGGCGSTMWSESLTNDYDLPNGTPYNGSCVSMAHVLFSHRMADATGEARYADVMEQILYNGALSGVSLRGDRFFYVNLLTADDSTYVNKNLSTFTERQEWFDCACCPTGFCRFLPQLGSFTWSHRPGELRCNIPAAGCVTFDEAEIQVSGRYPYDGAIGFEIVRGGNFALSVRIPAWCRNWRISLNGGPLETGAKDGYLTLSRSWRAGDRLELRLDLAVDVIRPNLKVTADAGKIALMRGPVVYALESVDNGPGVNALIVPAEQNFRLGEAKDLPGVPAILGEALRESDEAQGRLYFRNRTPSRTRVGFTAIPYALWQNRGKTELATWLRSN